ncbi:unnamed protein product [Lactuca virosa]|uniref:dUTP diphosphatase n=1 Tax=Lactuca virosa TaxID=75947 RepID=A0AAU9LIH0_9ASTR|nr:unnamed protein product [Lactuca virosa]
MANNNTDQVPPRVLVNRMSDQAVFPTGFILSSSKTLTIPPKWWDQTQVPTDLRFNVPVGVSFEIAPIPDVLPQSIKVMGCISPLKEAPVSVTIVNDSGSDFEIKAGDQIARMHTLCAIEPELVDVTSN